MWIIIQWQTDRQKAMQYAQVGSKSKAEGKDINLKWCMSQEVCSFCFPCWYVRLICAMLKKLFSIYFSCWITSLGAFEWIIYIPNLASLAVSSFKWLSDREHSLYSISCSTELGCLIGVKQAFSMFSMQQISVAQWMCLLSSLVLVRLNQYQTFKRIEYRTYQWGMVSNRILLFPLCCFPTRISYLSYSFYTSKTCNGYHSY